MKCVFLLRQKKTIKKPIGLSEKSTVVSMSPVSHFQFFCILLKTKKGTKKTKQTENDPIHALRDVNQTATAK